MAGRKRCARFDEGEAALRILEAPDQERAGGQEHECEREQEEGSKAQPSCRSGPIRGQGARVRASLRPWTPVTVMASYCFACTLTLTIESQLSAMNCLFAACWASVGNTAFAYAAAGGIFAATSAGMTPRAARSA